MRCSWINFAFVTSQMGSSFNPPFTCLHQVWLFIPLFSLSLFLSVYLFIRSCFRKFETILTQTRDKKEIQHAYGEQSHLFSLSLSFSNTQKHTHTHTHQQKRERSPVGTKRLSDVSYEPIYCLIFYSIMHTYIDTYTHNIYI